MSTVSKLLVLILALATGLYAKCGEGCLSCKKNSPREFECKVCDLHNGFTLTHDKVCVKTPIENCKLGSSVHSIKLCLKCNDGYFLDSELKICTKIPESSQIPFCKSYLSLNYCELCEDGYNLVDGLCNEVTEPIEGCSFYNPEGTVCLKCSKNKVLRSNECKDFSPKDKCMLYTEEECVECKDGYVFSPDYYSNIEITAKLAHKYIMSLFMLSNIINPFDNTCIAQDIPQCQSYINFTQCLKCNDGYFVNAQRICQKNPPNKIKYCEEYFDESTCKECDIDHFLNANLCGERVKTENCIKYEVTSSTCLECSPEFFLLNNMCVDRFMSKNIDYCEEVKIDADECAQCKERFVKTSDNLACLIEILNCNEYDPTLTQSSQQLICTECLPGYFLSATSTDCLEQFVENCTEYVEGSGDCSLCNDEFWLDSDSNECNLNTSLNCNAYSQTNNVCDECNLGFYLSEGQCFQYSITNCDSYKSDADECDACLDGYFLMEGECHLKNNLGCETFVEGSNDCDQCLSGYYKDENNFCLKQYIPNCDIYEDETNDCKECLEGYYYSDKLCIPNSVPNCITPDTETHLCSIGACEDGYYVNDKGYCILFSDEWCNSFNDFGVCTECNSGYYLEGEDCLPTNVRHCDAYITNSNTCSACVTGGSTEYYLDSDINACLPQILNGCSAFVNNSSLDCQTCENGFFLDSNDKTCKPYTVFGCDTYENNKNACSSCITSYYLDETTGHCVDIDIEFCSVGELNDNGLPICTTCIDGFLLHPLSLRCILIEENKLDNCVQMNLTLVSSISSPPIPPSCELCAYGYYLVSGPENCEPVDYSGDNCVEYTPNTDTCSRCENGYQIVTGSCSSTDYAIDTNGVDEVITCIPGYFVDNSGDNGVCTSNTGDTLIDTNCSANTGSDDSCSQCKDGYSLYNSLSTIIEYTTVLNCVSFDFTNEECIQCEPGYYLEAGACTSQTGDYICNQKEENDTTDLTDGTACLSCYDYDTHYLDVDECKARTVFYDNVNYNDFDNDYASCQNNLMFQKHFPHYSMCVVNNTYDDTPYDTALDTSCLVLDFDSIGGTPTCARCDSANDANAATVACDSNAGTGCSLYNTIAVSAGGVISLIPHTEATEIISDGSTTSCKETKVGTVVEMYCTQPGTYTYRFDPTFVDNNVTFGTFSRVNEGPYGTTTYPFRLNLTGCSTTNHTAYLKADDGTGTQTALNSIDIDNIHCNYYGVLDTTNEAICLHCNFDFMPKIVVATHLNDGTTPLDNPVAILTCDTTQYIFAQKYKTVYNDTNDLTNYPMVSDFISFDSCANGGTPVVRLNYISSTAGYNWLYDATIPFEGIDGAYCVDEIPEQYVLNGCMLYIASSIDHINDITDSSLVHCGSCKPGYKAFYTDGKITECSIIDNCNFDESVNNLPGGCNKCNDGFTTAINENLKYDWTVCHLKSEFDSNCEFPYFGETNTKYLCIKCIDGYNVSYDATYCSYISKTDNNCATYGYNTNALIHSNSTEFAGFITSNKDNLPFLFSYMYPKYDEEVIIFGCKTCSNNGILSQSATANTIQGCFHKSGFESVDGTVNFPDNCKQLDINGDCIACIHGYFADTGNSGACTLWTEPLMFAVSGTGTTINSCITGYTIRTVNNTNRCIKNNNDCSEYKVLNNNYYCYQCKNGYRPTLVGECELIPIEDPCKTYTGLKCTSCKNTHYPLNVYENSDVDVLPVRVICSEYAIDMGNQIHTYVNFYYSLSSEDFSATSLSQVVDEYSVTTTDKNSSFYNHVCVPTRPIPNCLETNNGITCKLCVDGYLLQDKFTCIKGDIPYCLTYKNFGNCLVCDKGFYAFSSKDNGLNDQCKLQNVENCIKYRPNTNNCIQCLSSKILKSDSTCGPISLVNCSEPDPSNKVCLRCEDGYYINDTDGLCTLIDNKGCLFTLKSTNLCAFCSPGLYVENGKCFKYSFNGCKIYHQSNNSCLQCEDNYFLDSNGKCFLRLKTNCAVASYGEDKCLSCSPDYYFSNDNCLEYTVNNCLQYHPYLDECTSCPEGFALNASMNCVLQTDLSCKKLSKYTNKCLQCNDGYFLDSTDSICKTRIKKCKVYNPNSDGCLGCDKGQYLNSETCMKLTVSNCEMASRTANRCLSCITNYYLAADGNCKSNTTRNCLVKNMYSNTCQMCDSGYFLNKKSQCEKHSVSNCNTFNPNNNSCLKCQPGYYITSIGNCEMYSVKNCFGHVENANRCTNCESGYYLFKGKCYPYTQKHCLVFTKEEDSCVSCKPEAYKDGKDCKLYSVKGCVTYHPYLDGCSSCDDKHFLRAKKCLPYDLEFCKIPMKKDNKCLECIDGPFYNNAEGVCSMSTKVDNCIKYHKLKDECLECEQKHFIKDGLCYPNPTGVTHCIFYHSSTLCGKCIAPYYLLENECLFSDLLIEGCAYYTHNGSCGECETGLFLEGNQCLPANNSTCLTFLDKDNCASCPENHVLDSTRTTIDCIPSGIENCSHPILTFEAEETTNTDTDTTNTDTDTTNTDTDTTNTDTDTGTTESTVVVKYVCKTCKPGYYLSNSECLSTSSVDNCLEYESETLCLKCMPNYTLSQDKLSCVEGIGSLGQGCLTAQKLDQPSCAVCEEGYFLKPDGTCHQCVVKGCAICDSVNVRKCKLCKNGFQMNELFYCYESQKISNDAQGFSDIIEGTELLKHSEEFISVMSSLFIWYLLMLVRN